MKKSFLVLMLAVAMLAMLPSCGGRDAADPVFEETTPSGLLLDADVTMGMTEGDVVNLYGDGTRTEQASQTPVIRVYTDNTCGYVTDGDLYLSFDYTTGFGFSGDNALTVVMHHFEYGDISGETCQQLLDDIEAMLTTCYGEPTARGEKWLDTTYESDEGMLKYAIENGQYQRIVLWKAGDMGVILNAGDQYVVYTTLENEISNAQSQIAGLN